MTTSTTDRRLVTLVLIVLAAVLLIPALSMGFGLMGYGPMMGSGMGPGGMWGDGSAVPGWALLVGGLMQLLFLALIVGIGYFLLRTLTRTGSEDRALEELRLAYARGDLTDEEYEDRHERLTSESSER